eukprot:5522892-Heterocapsa_arctica.AAC.1
MVEQRSTINPLRQGPNIGQRRKASQREGRAPGWVWQVVSPSPSLPNRVAASHHPAVVMASETQAKRMGGPW